MKRRPLSLLLIISLIIVSGSSKIFAQPSSGRDELIVNGGFEEGWAGWDKFTLGRGYASLDPVDAYDGQYSLAIQGTPTPQAGTEYGSGVNQTIEGPSLSLDLDFAFWAKPWVSGKGLVEIKAMLTLYISHQSDGLSALKIMYYVAWRGEAESWANIRQNEADYFVYGATPFSWNYFQTNIKNDFEERWGDSTVVSLSKIVLTLEIIVGYPATNTEYGNWDDVSLAALHVTSSQTGTTSQTMSYSTSTPGTTKTTTATITTKNTLATRTTEGRPAFFVGPEFTIVLVIMIIAAIAGAAIGMRRRGPKPTKPPTEPNIKYCIACGAAMPLAAEYCPKCGSSQ